MHGDLKKDHMKEMVIILPGFLIFGAPCFMTVDNAHLKVTDLLLMMEQTIIYGRLQLLSSV